MKGSKSFIEVMANKMTVHEVISLMMMVCNLGLPSVSSNHKVQGIFKIKWDEMIVLT